MTSKQIHKDLGKILGEFTVPDDTKICVLSINVVAAKISMQLERRQLTTLGN